MSTTQFFFHHDAAWKSAQIDHICKLSRLHSMAATAIDRKRGEIASLRRAVFESILISGRKKPQMMDVVTFLEAIFSLTSPCHLDGARQSAVLMQAILQEALTSLRDFPERDIGDDGDSIQMLDEAIAHLFISCENNAQRMTALLANADREIFALQDMLVKLAS
ncbi:hypothetical protein [Burkholderia gladioli]|uniref:hypothetical protein n=1 Tax=Burkholderia gladioli TaxID=28095 RepID=UPI00264CF721|nr:hypothetical protein [Burkholderia gladioli]MDN7501017.1 hypothetical protein [Burkholderia gladioli]